MVRLTSKHAPILRQLSAAAERKRAADARLQALTVEAVGAGVPALHVAEAAGIGRATLYRWINQGVKK